MTAALLVAGAFALSGLSYVVTDWCVKGRPVLDPTSQGREVEAA